MKVKASKQYLTYISSIHCTIFSVRPTNFLHPFAHVHVQLALYAYHHTPPNPRLTTATPPSKMMPPLQMPLKIPPPPLLRTSHDIRTSSTRQHLIRPRPPPPQPTLPTRQPPPSTLLAQIRPDIPTLPPKPLLRHILRRGNLLGPLDPLQRQPAIDMPDDMAMHQPGARVVALEPYHRVTRGRPGSTGADEHGRVAADGVVEVEGRDEGGVPGGRALAQDGHVVPVEMHRVGGEELVLDDEVVPFVGFGEVDGVADEGGVGGGGAGAGFGEGLERGLRVVDADGGVVEEPAEDGAVVGGLHLGDEAGGEERGGGLEG